MSIFTYRSKTTNGKTFPIIKSRWNTTKPGSANDTVVLPLTSDGSYNFYVEWGDGTADTITAYNQAEVTHQYSQTGIYDISIAGDVIGWQFAAIGDDDKILSISRADGLYLNSDRAFYGCSALTSVSSDIHFNDNMQWGFRNCSQLSNGLSNVDVSNVTGMRQLFDSCNLYNEDLSNWDTSNVKDMYRMFYASTGFKSSLANWDVSSCDTFDQIFGSTCGYDRLDFTGWNFGTSMRGLLWDADQIDLSSITTGVWYPTGIQDFSYFARDNGSTSLAFISGWDMSSATDMSYMFYNTDGFVAENLGVWDVSNVTNMSNMFNTCSIGYGGASNLGDWDTSSVTNMSSMFFGTEVFNDSSITGWDVSNVTNMSFMFYNASSFNQDLTSWDFTSCDNFSSMLRNSASNYSQVTGWTYGKSMRGLLSSLSTVDTSSWTNWHPSRTGVENYSFFADSNSTFNSSWITGWDMSNAKELRQMFYNARAFTQPVGVWDISNVTGISRIFYDADLFNQPLSGWNTSNVINMNGVFERCGIFNQDLGNWNTSNVTDMSSLFYRAASFNNGGSSSISGWDTSNVTTMNRTFGDADSFSQNINNWDTSNVTNMRDMFSNCQSFNQPIGSWDVGKVEDMEYMLYNMYPTLFDQDIGAWRMSGLTSNGGCERLLSCGFFNGAFNNGGSDSISGWVFGNATSFLEMFYNQSLFNQPIGPWDTSKITNMGAMLYNCDSFDQDLSNWVMTGVTTLFNFMGDASGLSTTNYDRTLSGWSSQAVLSGVNANFGGSKYSTATGLAYKNALVASGWTITDGGGV